MSEEKIYLIKNDHGEYLTVERTAPWWNSPVGTAVRNIDVALAWAEKYGGHVVTFVEEPEKGVLTKKQNENGERAHNGKEPENGRGAGRGRGWISGGAGSFKKKKNMHRGGERS